jgi:hypothetical protein
LFSGHTHVTAICLSKESDVLTRDTIEVQVIPLQGVRIQSPLMQLCVGCAMPVWASGVPFTITPLIIGSVSPPFHFKWAVSVPGIIQLQDVLHGSGIEVSCYFCSYTSEDNSGITCLLNQIVKKTGS